MQVHLLPVLKDNYTFVLTAPGESSAVVVDPAEASPVADFLERQGLALEAIWITHHHADHTDGIPGLLEKFGKRPVLCSLLDFPRVPGATDVVGPDTPLQFAEEPVHVLTLPGHADGHIGYHFPSSAHLFSGDVLFGASCGGVFTGTYDDMFESVSQIASLPPHTQIWCGHEYTGNNLRWAEHVLGAEALQQRKADHRVPSLPLRLEVELATNPFLRLDDPKVLAYTGQTEPRAVFKSLRLLKDSFS